MPTILEILHRELPLIKAAPYSFFITVFCIAALVWMVFEWRLRKYRKRLEGTDGSRSEASVKGSGNAHVNQFFGWMPENPLPSAANSLPGIEEEHPNLECIGLDYIPLLAGTGSHTLHRAQPGMRGDFYGLVACFRNEGDPSADRVKANIRFRDSLGKEQGVGVSGALWLGQRSDLVDINPDHTECVVVLVKTRDGMFVTPAQERRPAGFRRDSLHPTDLVHDVMPSTAEIRLRDKAGKGDSVLAKNAILEISEVGNKLHATLKAIEGSGS
jgi:hypothetical protein